MGHGVATSRDGVPIGFEVDGDRAPALVFVHGWSCDRTYWRGQLPHFARRFRVVAVDLAGHGESGTARRAWTMRAFGDDVVAVVEQLGLDEVVLVGHSMGGDVIVEAARRLDDRVKGVIPVDTYPSLGAYRSEADARTLEEPLRRDFVGGTRELVRGMFPRTADPALVEWVASDMASAPPQIALAAIADSIRNEPVFVAGIRELSAPVVAVNPGYRPTDLGSFHQQGADVVVMGDGGHFLMLEDPAGFNRILEQVIGGFAAA
jgi:pimeloyl-ACP methyl ester carboxylesterase